MNIALRISLRPQGAKNGRRRMLKFVLALIYGEWIRPW
jgi:hypothetical protein